MHSSSGADYLRNKRNFWIVSKAMALFISFFEKYWTTAEKKNANAFHKYLKTKHIVNVFIKLPHLSDWFDIFVNFVHSCSILSTEKSDITFITAHTNDWDEATVSLAQRQERESNLLTMSFGLPLSSLFNLYKNVSVCMLPAPFSLPFDRPP